MIGEGDAILKYYRKILCSI